MHLILINEYLNNSTKLYENAKLHKLLNILNSFFFFFEKGDTNEKNPKPK